MRISCYALVAVGIIVTNLMTDECTKWFLSVPKSEKKSPVCATMTWEPCDSVQLTTEYFVF